jgi:hypothetical protein
MADNHGQVWMQVSTAHSENPSLFRGQVSSTAAEIRNILELGSEPRFPIRRLITIWRNEKWRKMATMWCSTAVGHGLFRVSTWEWMISCRIDDVCAHSTIACFTSVNS